MFFPNIQNWTECCYLVKFKWLYCIIFLFSNGNGEKMKWNKMLHILCWTNFCQTIREDSTQQNSLHVGTYLMTQMAKLRDKYEVIGDVRGKGLQIGMEMVKDKVAHSKQVTHLWYTIRSSSSRHLCLNCEQSKFSLFSKIPQWTSSSR